jgi:hypothetical protein
MAIAGKAPQKTSAPIVESVSILAVSQKHLQVSQVTQLANLAEMVTVNGQGNSQGKQPGPTNKGPPKQFPVMNPLLTDNTQPVDRPQEGQDVKVLWRNISGQ